MSGASTLLFLVIVVSLFILGQPKFPQVNQQAQTPRRVPSQDGAYKAAVEQLRAALLSDDERIVMLSATSLRSLLVPELTKEMRSLKERGFQQAYISVLPELYANKDEKALQDMKEYLLSPDFKTTQMALAQMDRFPPLTLADELYLDLSIPRDEIVYQVGKVLRSWHKAPPHFVDMLTKIMNKSYGLDARVYAAITLISLGLNVEEAWKDVEEIVKDADEATISRICNFLEQHREPKGFRLLLKMLEEPGGEMPALEALINYPYEEKILPIKNRMRGGGTRQYYLALVNLASVGREEGLRQAFQKIEQSPETFTWADFVLAMRKWREPRAIDYYKKMLSLDVPRVIRMEISSNLRNYPWNRSAIKVLKALLSRARDEREISSYLKTLGLIGTEREVRVALKYLHRSAETETRTVAAWAILNMKAKLPVNTPSQIQF